MDDELDEILKQRQAAARRHNITPLQEFDNLSPEQMYGLLYYVWDETHSPLRWQLSDEVVAQGVPLRQALAIALNFFAGEKGAKLTPQGRWPRALLMLIYDVMTWNAKYPSMGPPRLEEDLPVAEMLHASLVSEGLLRKSKGHLLLTKKGRELLNANPTQQVKWLWQYMNARFNWAYLDGYGEMAFLNNASNFVLQLLLHYGHLERSLDFYVKYLTTAWPELLTDLPSSSYSSPEQTFFNMVSLRMFERFFYWFGVITLRFERDKGNTREFVQATPLLKHCWQHNPTVYHLHNKNGNPS